MAAECSKVTQVFGTTIGVWRHAIVVILRKILTCCSVFELEDKMASSHNE
jgi:hypothetical protein